MVTKFINSVCWICFLKFRSKTRLDFLKSCNSHLSVWDVKQTKLLLNPGSFSWRWLFFLIFFFILNCCDVFVADAHRLHHVSGLAWIDAHTLVTTSHDASVKQWTITYWASSRQTSTSPGTRTTVELNLFFPSFFFLFFSPLTVFSLPKKCSMLSINTKLVNDFEQ